MKTHSRYDEMMKERLARRRERLRQGLPVDDDEGDEDLIAKFEEDEGEGKSDAKAILEDMQKRSVGRCLFNVIIISRLN